MADLRILKAQLNQQLFMISQPNEKVMDAAWQRWDSIGKPLRSLGAMERAVVKMAGMENSVNVKMDKRAIVVLCGDHGVVREGVTQTDSSVTRIVADNIAAGRASINIMAAKAGADVFPVDVVCSVSIIRTKNLNQWLCVTVRWRKEPEILHWSRP